MIKKVFILGLPGSGKSEAARYIERFFKERLVQVTGIHRFTIHFNDYGILNDMSKSPEEGHQFKRLEPGGFDVVNFVAFDTALLRLKERIEIYLKLSGENKDEIIIIEFARNDYRRAFRLFGKAFIQDACFIHLNADVEVCKQRIANRVKAGEHADDYLVSDFIFEMYYHRDDGLNLPFFLKEDFEVDESQVLIIDNNHSLDEAMQSIAPFIDRFIDSTSVHKSAM